MNTQLKLLAGLLLSMTIFSCASDDAGNGGISPISLNVNDDNQVQPADQSTPNANLDVSIKLEDSDCSPSEEIVVSLIDAKTDAIIETKTVTLNYVEYEYRTYLNSESGTFKLQIKNSDTQSIIKSTSFYFEKDAEIDNEVVYVSSCSAQ
ncbi:hypothetical protein [Flammeovirga pacifica]|uniref:GOLD domain-containing protein n=1 Tax=Flammeovirga pacifica TaxID=915059 RepID=A0A1S1YW10_FLAPC|nr:hypothetical protein [Flammeovirga pacifica]OHX65218.1 hypothetical protein NH26_02040 [Flammeovirga pacifica]